MAFVSQRLKLENCMPLTTKNTDWKNHIQYNSDCILMWQKQYLDSYPQCESKKGTPVINFKVPLHISKVILISYLFFQDHLKPYLHIQLSWVQLG